MDKNTITGFLLIGAIIVIFTLINRPTAEQLEQQQRMRDSIALEEFERETLSHYDMVRKGEVEAANAAETVTDFFVAGTTVSTEEIEKTETDSETSEESVDLTTTTQSTEQFITLENEKIELVLSTLGGKIHSVRLKNEKRYNGDSLYLFEGDEARFNMEIFNRNSVRLTTEQLHFTPIVAGNTVTMRLEQSANQHIDFVYTLPADEYMMNFDIRVVGMKHGLHPESLTNLRVDWAQKIRQQEQGRAFENRFARLNYKYKGQKVQRMSNNKAEKKELSEPVNWFAFKDQFFSSIIIAEDAFSTTILETENIEDDEYIKSYKAETWVPVTMDSHEDLLTASFKYYFGINHFYTLKNYDKDVANKEDRLQLHNLVDLGYKWLSWVNQYFTIPVFNFFLGLNWSMGLIILIMTIMIKLIVLPMTFKSFKSSAKMRVLRPQVQAIEAKYPGEGQDVMMKRQQATMELYSKAGASPMSGCLPMLLQMPILMAFFFFFPSAIELRGQSFLWAHDLSTYDALIQWNFHIPIIGKFLGNHISIFCLLMTTVNIIYTKYNMQATDTGSGQMAGMKYMPFFMSGMMFFVLNSYPAGLNYYYFLSTLITIILTVGFKRFLNEDKLLAQMEANKKKPKKKSGFMARLEEAQKMQEKEMRERSKQQAKKRR